MRECWILALGFAAGLALGGFFYGGLWWTLRRGLASPHPTCWFVGSLLVRMAVILPGFYLVGQGQWPRFVACLLGFVLARLLVVRLTRLYAADANFRPPEAGHAP